jgi:tRNA modification GTPase
MVKDTIVAIATPPGRGGVGIIRLSGSAAYSIAMGINGNRMLNPRLATFCSFYSEVLIDQGLMIYFQSPHSFTGEDIVEIQAHGSPIVLDLLIKACIQLGARLAQPGEFSERAFLNDKIDLTQAEAIADLIQASSKTAARMALRSLQGEFSNKIKHLNEQIINLRLYVEAAIDFPEEEIDFLSDGKVAHLLKTLLNELNVIRLQASQGLILREGLSLVIAGRPNAGKSTLINKLAGRDVAIVTEIAGTTRDVMREHILLDDIPLHVIDTAGLRQSEDVVEQEGIRRAWEEVKKADCVLLVIDINDPEQPHILSKEIRKALPDEVPIITVFNKIDTVDHPSGVNGTAIKLSSISSLLPAACPQDPEDPCKISGFRGQSRGTLEIDTLDHPSGVKGTAIKLSPISSLLPAACPQDPEDLCKISGFRGQSRGTLEKAKSLNLLEKAKSLNLMAVDVNGPTIYLSAKSGQGIEALKDKIKNLVGYQPNEGLFLARRRHLQALDEAKQVLIAGEKQLEEHRAGELLAEDLRVAHQLLCEITGEFTSDDLLGRIFSSFCIGK